jgi:hypothetical protein
VTVKQVAHQAVRRLVQMMFVLILPCRHDLGSQRFTRFGQPSVLHGVRSFFNGVFASGAVTAGKDPQNPKDPGAQLDCCIKYFRFSVFRSLMPSPRFAGGPRKIWSGHIRPSQ